MFRFESSEFEEFMHLTLRAFYPRGAGGKVSASPVMPSATRVAGFLHLLQDVVRQLGIKLLPHLPRLMHILVFLLSHSCKGADAADVGDADIDEVAAGEGAAVVDDGGDEGVDKPDAEGETKADAGAADADVDGDDVAAAGSGGGGSQRDIRSLALAGLAATFDNYPEYEYKPWTTDILAALTTPLSGLVSSMRFAVKPSALLRLLQVMARHRPLAVLMARHDTAIASVVQCIAAGLGSTAVSELKATAPAVITCVYDVIDSLLALDTTLVDLFATRRAQFTAGTSKAVVEAPAAAEPALQLLTPYLRLLLEVRCAACV